MHFHNDTKFDLAIEDGYWKIRECVSPLALHCLLTFARLENMMKLG